MSDRSINRIRVELAAASVKLKAKYLEHLDAIGSDALDDFGLLDHTYAYCAHLRGEDVGCGPELDEVEALERELEAETRKIRPERWVARVNLARLDVKHGRVTGKENVDRVVDFLDWAQTVLRLAQLSERTPIKGEISSCLAPTIVKSSWTQYQNGHIRDAVLNAFLAIGDLLRERTGIQADGKALVELALSPKDPYLILSDLDSESGRNDQLGFMQMVSGAFMGIRNVKAHSLEHDLDDTKALQYLVFASLLARRIEEAKSTDRIGR